MLYIFNVLYIAIYITIYKILNIYNISLAVLQGKWSTAFTLKVSSHY